MSDIAFGIFYGIFVVIMVGFMAWLFPPWAMARERHRRARVEERRREFSTRHLDKSRIQR